MRPMVPWPYKFLIICWWLFFLYWVISSRAVKQTKEKEKPVYRLYHSGAQIVAIALIFGFVKTQNFYPLTMVIVPRYFCARVFGDFVCFTGLLWAIWARMTLADNWSASVQLKEGHELIQRGPYRFVRHPIYTGILAMMLGSAIVVGNLAALVGFVISLVSYSLKLSREEALMSRHFPEAYAIYRSRVKALVPFLF